VVQWCKGVDKDSQIPRRGWACGFRGPPTYTVLTSFVGSLGLGPDSSDRRQYSEMLWRVHTRAVCHNVTTVRWSAPCWCNIRWSAPCCCVGWSTLPSVFQRASKVVTSHRHSKFGRVSVLAANSRVHTRSSEHLVDDSAQQLRQNARCLGLRCGRVLKSGRALGELRSWLWGGVRPVIWCGRGLVWRCWWTCESPKRGVPLELLSVSLVPSPVGATVNRLGLWAGGTMVLDVRTTARRAVVCLHRRWLIVRRLDTRMWRCITVLERYGVASSCLGIYTKGMSVGTVSSQRRNVRVAAAAQPVCADWPAVSL
jgi:hypothetical protein